LPRPEGPQGDWLAALFGDITMRRTATLLCLAGLVLGNVGCILVIGASDLPPCKHKIVIDGEKYEVDWETRRAKRIDDDDETASEIVIETGVEGD
jgi:hypothetical protein